MKRRSPRAKNVIKRINGSQLLKQVSRGGGGGGGREYSRDYLMPAAPLFIFSVSFYQLLDSDPYTSSHRGSGFRIRESHFNSYPAHMNNPRRLLPIRKKYKTCELFSWLMVCLQPTGEPVYWAMFGSDMLNLKNELYWHKRDKFYKHMWGTSERVLKAPYKVIKMLQPCVGHCTVQCTYMLRKYFSVLM